MLKKNGVEKIDHIPRASELYFIVVSVAIFSGFLDLCFAIRKMNIEFSFRSVSAANLRAIHFSVTVTALFRSPVFLYLTYSLTHAHETTWCFTPGTKLLAIRFVHRVFAIFLFAHELSTIQQQHKT